jgi:hypothetical protein
MNSRITTILIILLLAAVTASAQSRPKLKPGEAQAKNLVSKKPPALSLEIANVTPVVEKVKRVSASTVCGGDRVLLRARSAEPSIKPSRIAWVASGGRIIGEGEEVFFDTTDLPPGAYHISAQVFYAGMGLCNGDCSSWDTKTVRVTECPKEIICFTSPAISVSPEASTIKPCEEVTFRAADVVGGEGYGRLTWTWSSSAGKLIADGMTAKLNTCDVAPGAEIEVTVKATSEYANCEASGVARVLLKAPPIPSREMTPCTTFKFNSTRVDNACKSILGDSVRTLQTDPLTRLVVVAYTNPGESASVARARGKNVRDRLADGSVGVAIDANRIIVRVGGVATDQNLVRIWFVPEGAVLPEEGEQINPGPVEPEKKHADDVLPAKKSKRSPRR